ncbi:PREDICTED: sprT-like domain-containing protein Spartan [Elephantulus edwardii]|uniref:sprT-like domain-containing protein Spartan n=1 Tax=Elephantulus edwardii TaxID=28737 RepID=UPI0003F0ECEC|nr:PREDICTED: sprT-like domain-containing protein Spartan [Elephantulus edwardii]
MDADLMLALQLQEEWDLQAARRERAQEPLSLVDASWELVDPTPDLQALFLQFNDRFFWGRLEAVEVKWSMRMTLCAGICSYEGRGGMCSIRLSEPLLKLRPRKDLVETLLHEMIHAYLFVTNNDKDREGHGPEFCKHMHRINRLTGANITVYHTFHDEVDEYRRHWWRCNGPCQYQKPFYGYVKRAINRAPSAHDYWWAEHQRTCGGTYVKIKEPENYSKGKGKTRAGAHPAAAENKDKRSQDEKQRVIPFTGKGYVLGERSSALPPRKSMSSSTINKAQDHSANALRENSKIEVKFEQSGSSKKPVISSVLTNSSQNVLSSYFPRVSVANQKAVRSVNGSPTSDLPKYWIPPGSQRQAVSVKRPLESFLQAAEPAALTRSHGVSASGEKLTSKRPRLEDKSVLDHFFIKKQRVHSGGLEPQCRPHPPSSAQGPSNPLRHSRKVVCPVCQEEVLESQINEHLDRCLEGDIIEIKS